MKTPGFNCRIGIFYDLDKNGKQRAYYWSPLGFRAIPIGLSKAEVLIAGGAADHLPCHPIKGPRG